MNRVLSSVLYIDNNIAFITKEDSDIDTQCMKPTVGVILKDNTVLVANMCHSIGDMPMISLIKECDERHKAVFAFYKVVGKMCHKEESSKYFNNPIANEHLRNGNPLSSKCDINRYRELSLYLYYLFNEYNA